MRVLFYDFDAGALGIQSLIAMLRPTAHEVCLYLDCSCPRQYLAGSRLLERLFTLSDQQICDDLLGYDADVICFSVTSLTYARTLDRVRLIKARNPNVIIICGGVHVTLLPEKVIQQPEIDFVAVGEAEFSFPAFLDALAELGAEQVKALPPDRLPGIWNLHEGHVVDRGLSPIPQDLDALPFIDKTLHHQVDPFLTRLYSTISIRGCFYACTFCNDRAIRDIYEKYDCKFYRARSVDSVLAELRLIKERHHPRHIEFHDDVFAASKEWLAEFSRRYPEEIGIPFNVQTHPLLMDDEKLEMLARSGCITLEIGMQSTSPEVRVEVLRRYETNECVEHLMRKTMELGMRMETDFIVDLPGETEEHLEQMLEFLYKVRPNLVNLHFLVYLPKTEITRIAMESGVLNEQHVQDILDRGPGRGKYPESSIGTRYRLLPIQIWLACTFPTGLARRINHFLQHTVLGRFFAMLAPLLVVLARTVAGLFDRRAYLYRWQFLFGIRNMGRVLLRKLFGMRPKRPHFDGPAGIGGDVPAK